MSVSNLGHTSQKIFEDYWETLGKNAFLHRVTDQAEVNGRSDARVRARVKAQPSDYLLTWNGEMCYAEVKSCSSKTSFPFSQIEAGQWVAAKKQVTAGGNYYFFIHALFIGRWFMVPAQAILDHKERSMKWSKMEEYRFWVLEIEEVA